MSKVISYISNLSDITEKTILGKTTTVMMTTDLISNTTKNQRFIPILSSNGGTKYRIYSDKTETATIITTHKNNEVIESNKILEVTYDKGSIHLLLNTKYTVIVAKPGSPMWKIPHSTSLIFCETNVAEITNIQRHPQTTISRKII